MGLWDLSVSKSLPRLPRSLLCWVSWGGLLEFDHIRYKFLPGFCHDVPGYAFNYVHCTGWGGFWKDLFGEVGVNCPVSFVVFDAPYLFDDLFVDG